jgi:nitric oxide reductase subunit C
VAGTTFFTLVFIALTIDSHRQFGRLTHEENITPAVVAGKHVWHRQNCINCHTLLGEGAYYAPDLTKITQYRGEPYLRQFLQDPSRYYSEARHGRLMPNPRLSEEEITNVIAFLEWVSHIDNQGWPPRPIVVSAAAPQGIVLGAQPPPAASNDPIALGEALFRQPTPGCFTCHSLQPNLTVVGPSLAGIGTRAAQTIAGSSYHGTARTVEEYLRESIVHPSVHLVEGPTFSAGGQSIMPGIYDQMLKADQIDTLVAYLATLK